MLEGLLCGLAGSLAAVLLLFLGKEVVLRQLDIDTTSSDARALSFSLTALALLLVGLGVGALGSGMTLRRFLKV
jgi:cell division transport system permease protein